MKKKLFIALGLTGIIALSASIGALGASNLQEIKVFLNKGVNVQLNGANWQPTDSTGKITYPITYNGTTYLPVKSIGDALGVKVGWEAKSNSVLIDAAPALPPQPTPEATPAPTPLAATPSPAPTPIPTPIPTTTPVGLPTSITIKNVTISLDAVVQDSDSLRLYVTYTNNSDKLALALDSQAKVVSGGTQYAYDTTFNFDRYYKKSIDHAPNSIEPGVTAKSVIFFSPLSNPDKVNIVLDSNFEYYRFNNIQVN